jgi:Uma2 family endonuclease
MAMAAQTKQWTIEEAHSLPDDGNKYYLDAGIPEYWIIDPDAEHVRVVKSGQRDELVHEEMSWAPAGVAEPLRFAIRKLFSD